MRGWNLPHRWKSMYITIVSTDYSTHHYLLKRIWIFETNNCTNAFYISGLHQEILTFGSKGVINTRICLQNDCVYVGVKTKYQLVWIKTGTCCGGGDKGNIEKIVDYGNIFYFFQKVKSHSMLWNLDLPSVLFIKMYFTESTS